MTEQQILEIILQSENLWIIVSILATLTLVQGFKAAFKELAPKMDRFTRKVLIFAFAAISGFYITQYFVDGELEKKWAVAVAILNPLIYLSILGYATKKRWLWLVEILKMRPFVERGQENETIIERKRFDDR